MSLRLKLTLLHGAILVATMAIAATLGASTARRAVEEVVQERTVEVARSIVADLELDRPETIALDHDAISDRLAAAMPLHRGVRAAELRLARRGKVEVTRIEFGPGGPDVELVVRAGPLPAPLPVSTVEEEDGRSVTTAEVAARVIEDVPLLAEHFAAKHGRGEGGTVSSEAREVLLAYAWPGNVRELENVIARALALNPSGVVVPADLPDRLRSGATPPPDGLVLPPGFRPTLDELSRRYAALVLAEHGGNKTRAADALGIDRKTLYRILGERE